MATRPGYPKYNSYPKSVMGTVTLAEGSARQAHWEQCGPLFVVSRPIIPSVSSVKETWPLSIRGVVSSEAVAATHNFTMSSRIQIPTTPPSDVLWVIFGVDYFLPGVSVVSICLTGVKAVEQGGHDEGVN